MEEAKPLGRPPMEDRSLLRKIRAVRFSDPEHEKIKALAQKAGLSFSEFVRRRALAKK